MLWFSPGARARELGALVLACAVAGLGVGPGAARADEWRALVPGVEYRAFGHANLSGADPRLHVVRIDPERAELRALMASELDGKSRTARSWCADFGLSVAINLGMYQTDQRSNVGYARNGDHVNSPRWASKYKSALAFSPVREDLPRAALFDVESDQARDSLSDYRTVIQNLRLIGSPGRNVWSKQDKQWSEAAIAMDHLGRLLFLLSRSAQPMWDFNEMLLSLPLGIDRAMHVEGGPEASLSIHVPGFDLDLSGTTFAPSLIEPEDSPVQWRVPNVVGVVAPAGAARDATRGSKSDGRGPAAPEPARRSAD
jgi:hypothetical protein